MIRMLSRFFLLGKKVIVDSQKSLERMTLLFYWAINIGAFFQLATSYATRRIGVWLAFFVPMIMYLFLPFFLLDLQNKLILETPEGSVLTRQVFQELLQELLKGKDQTISLSQCHIADQNY